ncbi:MAG TPA: NAD(P)H-dependent oxidoreductase [Sphingopyxis sp.]|nr:NAD(P)H-dependent oxidoreductase [Sphingopyxis sp.]
MAHKIAILVGSLRKDSYNRKIARAICALRDDNLDCSMVEIGDLPLYDQDYDSAPEQPAQYARFRDEIRAADGILFVSPEYNRGIPGVLKNAIDVGSRPYGRSVFDKKPAAVVTASIGAIGGALANHQIRQSCVFLNMPVMAQPEAYLGNVSDDHFEADDSLKDGPFKDVVTKLAHAFHDWIDMVQRSRAALAHDAAHAERETETA